MRIYWVKGKQITNLKCIKTLFIKSHRKGTKVYRRDIIFQVIFFCSFIATKLHTLFWNQNYKLKLAHAIPMNNGNKRLMFSY